MKIRTKMMFILTIFASVPMLILWGGQRAELLTMKTQVENLANNNFFDWVSGEIEDFANDSSLRLREQFELRKKLVALQAERIEDVIQEGGIAKQFTHAEDMESGLVFMDYFSEYQYKTDSGSSIEFPITKDFISLYEPDGYVESDVAHLTQKRLFEPLSKYYAYNIFQDAFHYMAYKDGAMAYYPAHNRLSDGYDPRGEEWFTSALSSENVQVTPQFKNIITNDPVMTISKQVRGSAGTIAGVTAIDFAFPVIFQLDSDLGEGEGRQHINRVEGLLLKREVDGDFVVLASQVRDFKSKPILWNLPIQPAVIEDGGDLFKEQLMQKVILGGETLMSRSTLKGKEYFWVFAPVYGEEMILAIVVPLQDVLARMSLVGKIINKLINEHYTAFVNLLIFAVALAAVVAFFMSKFVVDRIAILISAVQRIRDGEPNVRVESDDNDEISTLGHAINNMAKSVDERIH